MKPWLGRRASARVVSGEAAGPEVCGHHRTAPAALRESRPLPSQFSQRLCLVLGVGFHRCACLSQCLAQGVCGEHAVFTTRNESAVSEWLRLGGLSFPLRDSFLTELSWRPSLLSLQGLGTSLTLSRHHPLQPQAAHLRVQGLLYRGGITSRGRL